MIHAVDITAAMQDTIAGLIAVGIDFTEHSAVAASRATQLAQATGSALLDVHVVPGSAVVTVEPPAAIETTVRPAPTAEGRAALRAAADLAHAASVAAVRSEAVVRVGQPHEELALLAEERGAWLLVVGVGHEIPPSETLLLGTTAERALRHGSTPILVARERNPMPYRRALLAVDTDDLTPHVVRTLARVAPSAWYDVVHFVRPGGPEETRTRAYRNTIAWSLANVCRENGLDEARTEVHVFVGEPRVALASELRHRSPDLVAVGTHAPKGLARIARGSVADHAIHAAAGLDVLVVPPPRG